MFRPVDRSNESPPGWLVGVVFGLYAILTVMGVSTLILQISAGWIFFVAEKKL